MSDDENPHHFEFDLDRGIRSQVVEKLEASPLLSLAKNVGPALSGIYALYYKGALVYLGKAYKQWIVGWRSQSSPLRQMIQKQ
jgi:hypothetical protein